MKNKKALRLLLLVMSIAVVAAAVLAVSAAGSVGDVNGDGKVTIFDAQMLAEQNSRLRYLTASQKAAADLSTVSSIWEYIVGNPAAVQDENGDGIYEISTASGLYFMAQNPSLSYELTNDVDLDGAEWKPIEFFSGSLDGNGHTISNCVINQSVPDKYAPTEYNMGFFGGTDHNSTINDVHLRNVTVNADENAKFVGVLLGSSRGTVTDVTVTGGIYDTRESLNNDKIYIGVFAGRVTTGATASVVPSHTLSVTDDTGTYTVNGLCADMKMKVADSDLVQVGLVGWHPSGYSVDGQWVDTTWDSAQLSQTMQDRQDVVVDYMNAMGTIPWQVSEPLDYIPIGGTGSVHRQTFKTGVTYYGLPYTSNSGSLERFMSKIDTSSGKNVTIEGLEDGYYLKTPEEKKGYYGFVQYMGNDCSTAVGWAWMRVSPSRVNGAENEYAGGVHVRFTVNMVPNETVQYERGIYPVGDWTTVSKNDDSIVGDFAYTVTTETDTEQIYNTNGKETIAEAYAMTRKADALLYYSDVKEGGHARLAAADPIVIRNKDGSIDTTKSFFVTTEQGDGLYDRTSTNSSWRVNYKYTFEDLLNTDYNTSDGSSGGVYVPITMRALRSDYVKHSYFNEYPDVPVVSPINGKIHSNFRIISSTVTVTDAQGQVIYDNEVYTGVHHIYGETRKNIQTVDLAEAHTADFTAAAQAAGMSAGTKYHYSVSILLSNGETKVVKDNETFTYEG
ncbi:MAG: hypothetical protein IJO45_06025 [Oscillospiraceae bacterium]|nr:hypothetical protein [Oscillospiraceae bacterium]